MSLSKIKFDKKIVLSFWIILIALIIAAPTLLPVFRLNLLGRYLSLSIVALGVDLIWGYTGLLSLGQGIFFALGGYCAAMYLQITSSSEFPNNIPEFFALYGVEKLPFFWEPFKSPVFTFFAIWIIPALIAGLLGFLVFRNRSKGVYFSILTQASLLVFFNFFIGQQKLINGTNGIKTDVTQLFGQMVGSESMQRIFFWVTAILVIAAWFFAKWVVKGRFGNILIGIRDDDPRVTSLGKILRKFRIEELPQLINVFLGITSQEGFSSIFRSITILIAAIGLVLTPIYLLSMCRRVFFGPRIPALATVKEMNGRELTIGFSLLLPTLVIGFWHKIAINLYESSTNALSQQLTLAKLVGLIPTLVN